MTNQIMLNDEVRDRERRGYITAMDKTCVHIKWDDNNQIERLPFPTAFQLEFWDAAENDWRSYTE